MSGKGALIKAPTAY